MRRWYTSENVRDHRPHVRFILTKRVPHTVRTRTLYETFLRPFTHIAYLLPWEIGWPYLLSQETLYLASMGKPRKRSWRTCIHQSPKYPISGSLTMISLLHRGRMHTHVVNPWGGEGWRVLGGRGPWRRSMEFKLYYSTPGHISHTDPNATKRFVCYSIHRKLFASYDNYWDTTYRGISFHYLPIAQIVACLWNRSGQFWSRFPRLRKDRARGCSCT